MEQTSYTQADYEHDKVFIARANASRLPLARLPHGLYVSLLRSRGMQEVPARDGSFTPLEHSHDDDLFRAVDAHYHEAAQHVRRYEQGALKSSFASLRCNMSSHPFFSREHRQSPLDRTCTYRDYQRDPGVD